MGLFDSLTLTGAQRNSLNTIISLSEGDVDSSLVDSSLFEKLGLSKAQADKLAKAFLKKSTDGFSIELVKEAGLIEALNLNDEQTQIFNIVMDNYGKKITYQNLMSSNFLEILGLTDTE